jgi:hypothetical protein
MIFTSKTLRLALASALLFLSAADLTARDVILRPQEKLNELQLLLDEIRTERTRTGDSSPVRIVVEDGTYRFDSPLNLGPADSNLAIEARQGTHPTFTGGKAISGWSVDARGVWTTHIDPAWNFETLWVNGRRAVRARTPNNGFAQGISQPTVPIENIPLTGDPNKMLIAIKPDNAASLGFLTPEEQQEVQALVYHSWDVSRLRVAGVSSSEGKIQFTGSGRDFFSSEAPPRLRFENYLGALDEPGEWFLEKNGTLHYIPLPGETPKNTVTTAPLATQWVVIKGDIDKGKPVENVSFKDLTFQYQKWITPKSGIHAGQIENGLPLPAIESNGARNLSFQNCTFEHTSTHAIWLRNGCSNSQVVHCLFQDLGAGGVYVGDPGVSKDGPKHTHHIKVENSIFRGGGRHFPAGIGVSLFHASDCEIRHCDVGDFFYSAISIGWTWGYKPTVAGRNLVEHCHLHHLGWGELSDMGAVYTLGQQLGTVIRNNHIHSIGCASYGAWGMYNDEGSTGILWENNLVHDTQTAGYHQHYGRGNIVRNNILAWGNEEHIRRSKPEDMLAFAFERNIVLMGEGRLLMQADKNWHDGRVFMADNVYWHAKGAPTDFAGKTWAEWQAAGNDVRSVLADPLFRDPAKGDWSLSEDSPALKLGFRPFDWKTAGVEGDPEWKAIAAQPLPPMVYGRKASQEPIKIDEQFETFKTGDRISLGRKNRNQPALFAVENIPGATGHCLEFRDGPDQAPAFEPHFYFNPSHTSGTTRVAFDLRMEPSHRFLHEWRDASSPYKTSVYMAVENGTVRTAGKKLAEFPPLTWVHFEIQSAVGKDSDGSWTLRITPAGGETQTFENLPSQKGGGIDLQWLGFISPGTAVSKGWLDNLQIENQ